MRRFSTEEVLAIMGEDHRCQTAYALAKPRDEVSNLELITHWLEFHIVPVIHFMVESAEKKSPHGDDELGLFI